MAHKRERDPARRFKVKRVPLPLHASVKAAAEKDGRPMAQFLSAHITAIVDAHPEYLKQDVTREEWAASFDISCLPSRIRKAAINIAHNRGISPTDFFKSIIADIAMDARPLARTA